MIKKVFKKIKKVIELIGRIKGIYKVYIVAGIVSIVLISLFFINSQNPWCIVSCSIGASGVCAVLLAIFIELANHKATEKNKKLVRREQFKIFNALLSSLLQQMAIYVFEQKRLLDKFLNKESLKEGTLYCISIDSLLNGLDQLRNNKSLSDKKRNRIKSDLYGKASAMFTTSKNIYNILSELNHSIKVFEAMEYFTSEDIRHLKSLEYSFQIINTKDDMFVYALKIAFDSMLKIEEFKKLKDYKAYYKDGKVSVSKKIESLGIEQEGMVNAEEIVFDNLLSEIQ